MLVRNVIVLLSCAVVGVSWGGCSRDPPPPGYRGAVPSGVGQQALAELDGRTITLAQGAAPWTVAWFAVVPNPVTGLGPVVCLKQGTLERYVPMPTDAEVDDFVARANGRVERPSAVLDPAYLAAMQP
ncbi:MAG: hypothetical protein JNL94_05485 [Planctomycetes bacterium]|nr:hypothetical protein [Planctomycetota bacterium]